MNRETIIRSGADLFSVGKLAELLQRHPKHILAAAGKLQLQPLSIDCIPFFDGEQAEQLREFLATHAVRGESSKLEAAPIMEPPYAVRKESNREPLELLERIEAEQCTERRVDLVYALAVACGQRAAAAGAAGDHQAMIQTLMRVASGDDSAIDDARSWIAENLTIPQD